MSYYFQRYKSPVGELFLVEQDAQLRALIFLSGWEEWKTRYEDLKEKNTPLLQDACSQLSEYFAGKRRVFNLPYKLEGTTFQKKVWTALAAIPFGETRTYKQQAEAVDSPKAVRAIGRTNGLNPISIILPCHRVIGSNGTLTGYGGGLDIKRFLLTAEGVPTID